jgi:hypothetical protein
MVKETTIVNDECFIMVNYCNLLEENFEQSFLYSDKSKNNLNQVSPYIDITMREVQSKLGVLTTYFKYRKQPI